MHRRREFLAAVGTAGTVALPGCSASPDDGSGREPTSFEFAGVLVASMPGIEQYQPLDVSVAITRAADGAGSGTGRDRAEGPRYEATHTIDDVTTGVAVVVREPWMPTREPHAITVSSPVHEATTVSTATIDEHRGVPDDRQVALHFRLSEMGISHSPLDVEDEWGGS